MDPVSNPYTPGAGTQPPELAGRDDIREQVRVALARVGRNLAAKSVIMVGLRGVGKTVLLDRMREDALAAGIHAIRMEAPENRSLPALLAPQLRVALLKLGRSANATNLAQRALRGLAGFAKSLKVKYQDIEVGLDFDPEPGLADNGDLEHDLSDLLEAAGKAAQAGKTVLALFIDELQYVKEAELAALITALHRCAQRKLPVVLVGAGLPQLLGRMGSAKSYSERLFDFPVVDKLDVEAASRAISKPALDQGVDITQEAVARIVDMSQGYPYYLQEWGKHAWEAATASPIDLQDVMSASTTAIAALDESFFRVRFDRLTPAEKKYLRAMAELGPGPHRSGDIADTLGREVSSLGPMRSKLIAKGMIWSPNHGDTAFTVPLFDECMRRTMPKDWRVVL